MQPVGESRGGRWVVLGATGLFLAAAVLATAPAIRNAHTDFLAGGAPGHGEAAAGDHLQTAYRLWLPGSQLERGAAPWRDPYSFRPEAKPQLNPAAWPFGLPFWPLERALGVVVGWNALVLLGLLAAGLLTFLWLRELEGVGWGAALVGGLVFEVAPYRLEQSTEHLLGLVSILLPLALWTFERARRGSAWWLLPSALAIASIPASGQVHLALGAVPFYLVYAFVRTRERWPLVAAVAATGLAVAAGVLLWWFVIDGSIGEGGRSLRQVDKFSAEWLDFVVRHARHGTESFVFLGWLTPLVAIAGLVLLFLRRTYGLAILLGLAAVLPILLALGTNTPLYRPVRFVLYPLRFPRVPERLLPIACLAIAALVAFAVSELSDLRLPFRLPRQALVVTAIAVCLLLADLRVTTFRTTEADAKNAAYSALAGSSGRLVEVPVFRPGIHYGGVYLYYDMRAKRERPQGYSTLAPVVADTVAKRLAAINCGDWRTGSAALLDRLGVRQVMFHAGLFKDNPEAPDTAAFAWDGLVAHGYRPVATDGPVTLLAVRPGAAPASPVAEPPRNSAVFCDGWGVNTGGGRTTTAPHASFWVYNEGGSDLRLFLRTKRPSTVRIGVDGRTGFPRQLPRLGEARVPLGPAGWHLVTFDGPPSVRVVAYALS